jgi:hypothetical protein
MPKTATASVQPPASVQPAVQPAALRRTTRVMPKTATASVQPAAQRVDLSIAYPVELEQLVIMTKGVWKIWNLPRKRVILNRWGGGAFERRNCLSNKVYLAIAPLPYSAHYRTRSTRRPKRIQNPTSMTA